MNRKQLEAIADIAYIFGSKKYFSENSREDISEIILLANKFVQDNENTDWDDSDYIFSIERFAEKAIKTLQIDS